MGGVSSTMREEKDSKKEAPCWNNRTRLQASERRLDSGDTGRVYFLESTGEKHSNTVRVAAFTAQKAELTSGKHALG